MEIRNATPDDLKAVAAVEAECFPQGEAATEEALRERLLVYPDHFWLLFDGDRLVGFVNGMVSDEPDLRDGTNTSTNYDADQPASANRGGNGDP